MVDVSGTEVLVEEQLPSWKEMGLSLLPTGKPHISFSELSAWSGCSWAHKLKHIDRIDLDKPGWGSSFGTIIHDAHEKFIRTRIMDVEVAVDSIKLEWETHKFIDKKNNEPLPVEPFIKAARDILETYPAWFDETFKNWTYVDAEHLIYEPIEGKPHAFKGYVDAIIECDGARGKRVFWVLDAKTSGWGWDRKKRSDAIVKSQLVFYKNYWSKKTGIDPKSIRCGFVILKRSAKRGMGHELFPVSVGETTSRRSLDVIDNMLYSVKNGVFLKNKTNCKYCPYRKTEYCTGTSCA